MTNSETITRRYRVRGRVQGVFFRASAREQARELGLSGWVRNLDDGCVEALAAGGREALEAFERWLARGPEQAAVTGVSSEASDEDPGRGFEIR